MGIVPVRPVGEKAPEHVGADRARDDHVGEWRGRTRGGVGRQKAEALCVRQAPGRPSPGDRRRLARGWPSCAPSGRARHEGPSTAVDRGCGKAEKVENSQHVFAPGLGKPERSKHGTVDISKHVFGPNLGRPLRAFARSVPVRLRAFAGSVPDSSIRRSVDRNRFGSSAVASGLSGGFGGRVPRSHFLTGTPGAI